MQETCTGWICYYGRRQHQNAFDPIVIIIELSYRIVYRDNFDLSYRLSIGNSIWHIVTALLYCTQWCEPPSDFHCGSAPPPSRYSRFHPCWGTLKVDGTTE